MIITYEGGMGSGKTLSAVRLAKRYYDNGFRVYSNITLNFPYTKLTMADMLAYASNEEQFKNCFFLIDEFAIFIGDSRRSASARNIAISYFIVMTRKLNINIALTTQTFGMIEKRVRENTSILVECKTFKIGEETDPDFSLIVRNKFITGKGRTKTIYYEGNEFFPLYDTYEIVNYELPA